MAVTAHKTFYRARTTIMPRTLREVWSGSLSDVVPPPHTPPLTKPQLPHPPPPPTSAENDAHDFVPKSSRFFESAVVPIFALKPHAHPPISSESSTAQTTSALEMLSASSPAGPSPFRSDG